jgi:hypothetical protein
MSKLLVHEELIERGYNVIPTDSDKQPLAPQYKECYDRHCPELAQLFDNKSVKKRQAGLALLGRINPFYPNKILVIIDVDDPKKLPEEARALLKGAWHWLTGPRCPHDGDKHDITCGPVACRHRDHDFDISEAIRGEAYAVLVPADAEALLGAGVAKLLGGAVELRIRGYQLLPPSIHPSGVVYEWITPPWAGGEFKHPKELSVEEFKRLLELLKDGHAAAHEEPKRQEEPKECKRFRELSDEDVDRILEIIKPYYQPGFRNAVLYALLGILKRYCYGETSIRKFYNKLQRWAVSVYPDIDKRKDDYILEGVLQGRDWRLFGWPKLKEALLSAAAQVGRPKEDAEAALAALKKIIKPSRVVFRYCLEYRPSESGVICVKLLRAREVADGTLVEVVARGKKKGAGVSKVALLPRRMAIVRDPFYAEEYYVAYADGGTLLAVFTADDWDNFIDAIRQRPPYYVASESKVDVVKRVLPRVEGVISAGLDLDGNVVDPYGVIDAADYGVGALVEAYRWIRSAYSERNARLAWFNVMAAFAKLITPLVRFEKRSFVDYVVYNVGRGGEGKSTLARYILTPLLGGADALEVYNIRIDGAVRTEPQLRNLLALNRLPLILDEQTRRALVNNSAILLSAVVGFGTTGIHAARHGLGVAAKFRNLRGVIVFTNVPFSTFLREASVESSDYALIRRFIELSWDFESIAPSAFKSLPALKPIYGFASRLWKKYKEELTQAADLLELIEKIADAVAKEHPEAAEIAEYTKQIVAEISEEKRAERLSLRDEDVLVERAYKFVAEELKVTGLSAIKVLRYILENPARAGLSFTTPKSGARELADDVYNLITKIKNMYITAASQTQERIAEDAAVVVNILNKLVEERRVAVVILAKSPLIPGVPKEFVGVRNSVYMVGGVRRIGYAVPLARFISLFIRAEEVAEEVAE